MRRWLALLAVIACSKNSPSTPPDGGPSDAGPLLHVTAPAWQEQVVYFVMTDRFSDGDKTNDDQKAGEYDPTDINRYSG
ncbi:MAG TPA: hypothetical protein VLW85_16995, partial [Myxococcales bacterium]|nr:hypothetical protein [Myxococcales bacterium]